jgi:hypothetical protein
MHPGGYRRVADHDRAHIRREHPCRIGEARRERRDVSCFFDSPLPKRPALTQGRQSGAFSDPWETGKGQRVAFGQAAQVGETKVEKRLPVFMPLFMSRRSIDRPSPTAMGLTPYGLRAVLAQSGPQETHALQAS